MLLRERDGTRYLPIWIGAVEASAIAFQQQGMESARPLTHDLLRDVIEALGARLEAVHITELRDDIFYAELRLSGGVTVSARPSDAIALALRCDAEILGAEAVLDAVGVEIPDDQEDEVERFPGVPGQHLARGLRRGGLTPTPEARDRRNCQSEVEG